MENKVAIVTGGGGYIGGAVCEALAKNGVRVAVCDINSETAEKTVKIINESGGMAKGYAIDVTDSESVTSVFDQVVSDYGRIDVMVHVAGGSARIAGKDAKYAPLSEQEDYVIDKVLKVNLYGAMYASRAAAKQMIKQGSGGKIINFSSIVGLNGLKCCTEYAVAKGGVIALTKSLAKELGEYKINVNSVAPGIVMRPEETGEERAYNTNFLKRKCLATDIANMVEFLASDKADFITGQVCVVDGGRSLAMKGSD